MNPAILWCGLLVFALCFFLHVVLWRISLSRVSSLLLVVILVVIPAAAFTFVLLHPTPWNGILGLERQQFAEAFLLHLSLAGLYIASYPAVRAISPSLELLLIIGGSSGGELSSQEIAQQFVSRTLVNARLDDLAIYGFLQESGGVVQVTWLGRITVAFFRAYRTFLGLDVGAG